MIGVLFSMHIALSQYFRQPEVGTVSDMFRFCQRASIESREVVRQHDCSR